MTILASTYFASPVFTMEKTGFPPSGKTCQPWSGEEKGGEGSQSQSGSLDQPVEEGRKGRSVRRDLGLGRPDTYFSTLSTA